MMLGERTFNIPNQNEFELHEQNRTNQSVVIIIGAAAP